MGLREDLRELAKRMDEDNVPQPDWFIVKDAFDLWAHGQYLAHLLGLTFGYADLRDALLTMNFQGHALLFARPFTAPAGA